MASDKHYPIVVAISGASGAVYALRLIEVLLEAGREVHLSISPSGNQVLHQELNLEIDLEDFDPGRLLPGKARSSGSTLTSISENLSQRRQRRLHYHHHRDFMSGIASGSFLTAGMVICPCSGTTLSAIASGMAGNLIQRAAEVHLKERRKLIVVPRETPLSLPAIDNMRRVTEAGAVVLPASPGWYHGVASLADLVDFVVARILDQLGVEHALFRRWGSP